MLVQDSFLIAIAARAKPAGRARRWWAGLTLLLALLAGPAGAQTTRTIDLRPQWDSTTVLRNPHKGWYHHYYDNTTGAYLTRADSDLDNFPGLNHLFLRFAWSYLEPTEGQFNWALIDNVVSKWAAKGYTLSFSITCKETGMTYATPEWVKNAGAQGTFYNPWGVSNWEPDYGDPIFLAKLGNFHRAFAARYNGATWLEYVTVGSFGDWGEGHTTFSSNRDWPVDVIKKHLDLYKKYYTVPVYLSDDFVGGRYATDGSATQIKDYANQLGFSWRDDSMLVKWYTEENAATYSIRSPFLFTETWTSRPTLLEAQHYHLQKSDGVWQGPDGATKGGATLLGALRLTHASYIGYHGYADEWLAENPNLARQVANLAGYWYFPRSAELPTSLTAGSAGALKLTWENHGVAPAYHGYKLKLKLESPGGTVYAQNLAEANNRQWPPGRAGLTETYALQPLPATAAAGTYRVRVALVEERGGTTTVVKLALKNALKGADGYYQVGTVAVAAPAPAAEFSGAYRLLARHSGKALDINAASTANEAPAIQWAVNGGANQVWEVAATGAGYYKLTAQHSGKCLDVARASTAEGATVQQYPANGNAAQQWLITPTSDGYYKLTARHSGKCLDVDGGPTANGDGALVKQYTYGGKTNQQWKFEPVAPATAKTTLLATGSAAQLDAGLQAYPNPTDGRVTLRFVAVRAQAVQVQVYNGLGQRVRTQRVAAQAGANEVVLDGALAAGLYRASLTVDGQALRTALQVK